MRTPRTREQESRPCLLVTVAPGGLAGAVLEHLSWGTRKGRASALTSSVLPDLSELANPKIYSIREELVSRKKRPGPLIQSCGISTMQDNNRIRGRNPEEAPTLMVSQKPEIQNHEHLQTKTYGQRDSLGHTTASSRRCFLCFVFIVVLCACVLFWVGFCKGKGQI